MNAGTLMLGTSVVVEVLRARPSVVRETLVTANVGEFSRVPGLTWEKKWSAPA